jgi:hypothetical protein
LLDLDYEIPDEQRIDELVAMLRDRLLPLIERGNTVAGLRTLLDEGGRDPRTCAGDPRFCESRSRGP